MLLQWIAQQWIVPEFCSQPLKLCNGYCSEAHFSLDELFVHLSPISSHTATPQPCLMLSAHQASASPVP